MPKDKKGVKRNKGDDGPPKKLKRVDEKETDKTKGTIRKEKPHLNEHERLKSVKNSLLFDASKPKSIAMNEKKESDETKPEPLAILNESHEGLNSMLKGSFLAASNQNSIATNEKVESMSKPIIQDQENEIETQQRLQEKITKLGVELKFAVLGQNLRMIKELVEFFRFDALKIATGADEIKPTMPRKLQYSLLSLAINSEDFQIVKFLIDTGFDVNYQDLEEWKIPLLHQAVDTRDGLIIRELLNNGADVNAESRAGILESGDLGLASTTALHLAISNEEDDYIIKMLLDNGANIGVLGSDRQSAMHHAVVNDNLVAADALFEHYVLQMINKQDSNDESEQGFLGFLNLLQEKFSNDQLSQNTSIWNFALFYAAEKGYNEIIDYVLYTNSDFVDRIDEISDWRCKILHKATIIDIDDLAELILKNGAEVNSTDGEGQTPLHCAAINNEGEDTKIAQLLLKYGADVNAKDEKQQTPLHTAVYWDNKWLIQILIEHGADIFIENNDGKTALDICVEEKLLGKDYSQRFELFISCIIMHYSDNSDVRAKLSDAIEECPDLLEFRENCLKEIQNLKSYEIEDTNVTLFKMLSSQNLTELASFARNETIEEVFESNDFNKEFPIYGSLLSKAFKKGKSRKILEDKANRPFCFFRDKNFQKLPNLPRLVIDKIISYLANDDLVNLTSPESQVNEWYLGIYWP